MSEDVVGSAWSLVLDAALLGTERRAWNGCDVRELPQMPAGAAGLLQSAALLTTWREAGRTVAPPPFLPPVPPAPDPRPLLGSEQRRLLATILRDRRHAALLDEWLSLAADSGRRLPGVLLVDLMQYAGLDDPDRRSRLRELGGPLLAWLGTSNPDWQSAVPADPPEISLEQWDEASDEDRIATFRRLRSIAPAEATELLNAALPGEPAATAAVLIDCLSDGLSDSDIDLLESALADRRKRVRSAAAELLGRLPGSPRAQRLAALAVPVVAVTGRLRRSLSIAELPPADEQQERDGIVGSPSERLQRAVTGASLDAWASRLGQAPAVLARLAVTSQDPSASVLLAGWAAAASRQRDRTWVLALLDAGLAPDDELLAVLEADEADRCLAIAVAAADLAGLPALIGGCSRPWGPRASSAAIAAIGRIVARVDLSNRPDVALTNAVLSLQSVLAPLALRLHPRTDVTPLVDATSRAPNPPFWLSTVAGSGGALGVVGILAFRAALAAAFEPSAATEPTDVEQISGNQFSPTESTPTPQASPRSLS